MDKFSGLYLNEIDFNIFLKYFDENYVGKLRYNSKKEQKSIKWYKNVYTLNGTDYVYYSFDNNLGSLSVEEFEGNPDSYRKIISKTFNIPESSVEYNDTNKIDPSKCSYSDEYPIYLSSSFFLIEDALVKYTPSPFTYVDISTNPDNIYHHCMPTYSNDNTLISVTLSNNITIGILEAELLTDIANKYWSNKVKTYCLKNNGIVFAYLIENIPLLSQKMKDGKIVYIDADGNEVAYSEKETNFSIFSNQIRSSNPLSFNDILLKKEPLTEYMFKSNNCVDLKMYDYITLKKYIRLSSGDYNIVSSLDDKIVENISALTSDNVININDENINKIFTFSLDDIPKLNLFRFNEIKKDSSDNILSTEKYFTLLKDYSKQNGNYKTDIRSIKLKIVGLDIYSDAASPIIGELSYIDIQNKIAYFDIPLTNDSEIDGTGNADALENKTLYIKTYNLIKTKNSNGNIIIEPKICKTQVEINSINNTDIILKYNNNYSNATIIIKDDIRYIRASMDVEIGKNNINMYKKVSFSEYFGAMNNNRYAELSDFESPLISDINDIESAARYAGVTLTGDVYNGESVYSTKKYKYLFNMEAGIIEEFDTISIPNAVTNITRIANINSPGDKLYSRIVNYLSETENFINKKHTLISEIRKSLIYKNNDINGVSTYTSNNLNKMKCYIDSLYNGNVLENTESYSKYVSKMKTPIKQLPDTLSIYMYKDIEEETSLSDVKMFESYSLSDDEKNKIKDKINKKSPFERLTKYKEYPTTDDIEKYMINDKLIQKVYDDIDYRENADIVLNDYHDGTINKNISNILDFKEKIVNFITGSFLDFSESDSFYRDSYMRFFYNKINNSILYNNENELKVESDTFIITNNDNANSYFEKILDLHDKDWGVS